MPDSPRKVYFVGIGGVGMSGLAQILRSRGVEVVGSDPGRNEATRRLEDAGARIYQRQEAENIRAESPDLVVMTAAVKGDHPEVAAAREAGIDIISRAAFLGQLMKESGGPRIAVTGTHGKTTTTSMIAAVLIEAGLNPTVLVGGEFAGIGGNVRVGGSLFVTEACEAYDSFLQLQPDIAVITYVEADHLDYYGSFDRLRESFYRFLDAMPRNAAVVWCAEDPGASQIMLTRSNKNALRSIPYGFGESSLVRAESIEESGTKQWFKALGTGDTLGSFELSIPGRHNVLNALAAIAVGRELGIDTPTVAAALKPFAGPGRRFDIRGERDGITVIDDYAHHPTEVRATISTARAAFPSRRLIVAFQPHLYSRTRDFLEEFAAALDGADSVLVTDIYAAREQPIPGISAAAIVRVVAKLNYDRTVMYVPSRSELIEALGWIARPGDVVITMGAGDIDEAAERFLAA